MPTLLTFAIPFFLILAIVYGALEVSGVFKNRGVMAVISLVIALFGISSEPVIGLIYQILPWAVCLFIIIFFLGFIFSLFKGKGEKDYSLLMIIIGLALIFLINMGYDIIDSLLPYGMEAENFMVGTGLLLIVIIFYAVYKRGGE